ncbi:DUF3892 domain-containing protein [uncultured Sphaerochaeta sp.]|uniref:DUF3892 domain-containing protein n=1 Tax=uncultured Sphaerochaeta sp. TaxID=886478 RepID=UPI002AA819E6|nr:DUF3892 domain-containing protein [uncultured Sphaerochaeta sp.]
MLTQRKERKKMSSKAIAIRLNSGCTSPKTCNDISEIEIKEGSSSSWKTKAKVYDLVKASPGSIEVDRYPYPDLVPVLSKNDEKYVRSEPNDTEHDNLLKLPQE